MKKWTPAVAADTDDRNLCVRRNSTSYAAAAVLRRHRGWQPCERLFIDLLSPGIVPGILFPLLDFTEKRRRYDKEIFEKLLSEKQYKAVKSILGTMNPVDIAAVLP